MKRECECPEEAWRLAGERTRRRGQGRHSRQTPERERGKCGCEEKDTEITGALARNARVCVHNTRRGGCASAGSPCPTPQPCTLDQQHSPPRSLAQHGKWILNPTNGYMPPQTQTHYQQLIIQPSRERTSAPARSTPFKRRWTCRS